MYIVKINSLESDSNIKQPECNEYQQFFMIENREGKRDGGKGKATYHGT